MPSSDKYDVVLLGIRSRRVPSEPYEQTKRRRSSDKLGLFIQHRFASRDILDLSLGYEYFHLESGAVSG